MKRMNGSRRMNWFILAWIAIILFTKTFADFTGTEIRKTGLVSSMTIDEIMENQIRLEVVFGLETAGPKGWTEGFLGDVTPWIDQCNEAETIAVVRGKGMLDLYPGSLGQRVEVVEVLKDEDDLSAGEQIELFLPGGILEPAKQEYYYEIPMGLMEKDTNYLVFMKKSDLNAWQDDKAYIASSDVFAYINLELQNTPVIETADSCMTLDMTRGCDYLSCTKYASEQLDKIRNELVRAWYSEKM